MKLIPLLCSNLSHQALPVTNKFTECDLNAEERRAQRNSAQQTISWRVSGSHLITSRSGAVAPSPLLSAWMT